MKVRMRGYSFFLSFFFNFSKFYLFEKRPYIRGNARPCVGRSICPSIHFLKPNLVAFRRSFCASFHQVSWAELVCSWRAPDCEKYLTIREIQRKTTAINLLKNVQNALTVHNLMTVIHCQTEHISNG